MERCFKINGYCLGFKGFKDRRVAAIVAPDTLADTQELKPNSISVDQFDELISLLNKESSNEVEPPTRHAMMAGTYCFVSYSNTSWLLDSGDRDHICSTLENFHDYQPELDPNYTITMPDGSKTPVKHIGSIHLIKQIHNPT